MKSSSWTIQEIVKTWEQIQTSRKAFVGQTVGLGNKKRI